MNQLHSTAFEAYKLQSSFLREYLTRNPEETILVDSEVVVLCRNSGTWKILDYFLLYCKALVYTYILVSGFSAPLLVEKFWLVHWFGVLLACWGFLRKRKECLHYLNSTSHKPKNTPCSCRPGYKTSCSLQPTALSVGWLCIATLKAVWPSIIWVPGCVKRWWRVYCMAKSGSGGSFPKTGTFLSVCLFFYIFFFLLVVQLQFVIKDHPTFVKLKMLFTVKVCSLSCSYQYQESCVMIFVAQFMPGGMLLRVGS